MTDRVEFVCDPHGHDVEAVLARRVRNPTVTEALEWRSATGIAGPRRLPLRFEPS